MLRILTETTTSWLNSVLRWPPQRRRLFYLTFAGQLEAGVAAGAALTNLVDAAAFDKATTEAARSMRDDVSRGRAVWQALDATRSAPADEVGLVRVAEGAGLLAEGLRDLARLHDAKLGIARCVIGPNAYYLGAFAAALVGIAQLDELLMAAAVSPEGLADNAAYELSRAVSHYGPAAVVGIAVLAVLIGLGRARWIGGARVLLGFFDREHRARVGLQFAEHAARLYGRGATHADVLQAFEDAYARRGFKLWAVAEARRDHVQGGVAIEAAIRGRLVAPRVAGLLAGMVPGGDRKLYPRAWATIAETERALLEARFSTASNIVRFGTIALLGGLMSIVVPGMYSAYTVI